MSWIGEPPFKELGMTESKLELLEELAEDSEYWSRSLKFVKQVSSRKFSTLTDNQKFWLQDIIDNLAVQLDKRTAKDVFLDCADENKGKRTVQECIRGNYT